MKTKSFRVIGNRIQFRCPSCNAKRSVGVGKDVRRRSVRCHKCRTVTPCDLNRRLKQREMQSGKCVMITSQGKEIDIDLHDISMDGLGFDLPINAARTLRVQQQVQFKCSWNPRLLGSSRFVVKSIKGRRVGAEKIKKWS